MLTILIFVVSCTTNKELVYYWPNENNSKSLYLYSESHLYPDSTWALFKIERRPEINWTKVSVHYPYYYHYSKDTLIVTAPLWEGNEPNVTKTNKQFEIEKLKVKGHKLIFISGYGGLLRPENDLTGFRMNRKTRTLIDQLKEFNETDSITWDFNCYDSYPWNIPIQEFNYELLKNIPNCDSIFKANFFDK